MDRKKNSFQGMGIPFLFSRFLPYNNGIGSTLRIFFSCFCIFIGLIAVRFSANAQGKFPAGVIPLDATDTALSATVQMKDTTPTEKILYIFDLEKYLETKPTNKTWQYDVINIVSALQGLVNRDEPQLYILYVREMLSGRLINVDQFWLDKLRTRGFFADYRLVSIDTIEDLLDRFRDYYTFTVLWDPTVPATGNVALTISGADSFLPIRQDASPDSLFSQIGNLIHAQERLAGRFAPVNLIPDTTLETTNTKKNDAYLWAKVRYLDKGACSPTHLAFFLDPYDWDPRAQGYQYPDLQNCMIVNHDYYIAQKAFFMDLDPWWDEVPTDIPHDPFAQAVDQKTFLQILDSAYRQTVEGERILKVGGFIPWWIKYSNYNNGSGKHKLEDTVEEFISILSAYNGVVDGGGYPFAALANASVYQHIPIQERYFQNPAPHPVPLENKNYILFVIGDFYSSSLLYQTMPTLWEDLSRGVMPIAWAISPLLSERIPHVFDYLYQTRTSKDFFVSASAGAGLCYPNRFVAPREHSNLGDGLYFWEKLARQLYQKFDMRITVAANLDRENLGATVFKEDLQRAFKPFSSQGVSTLKPVAQPLLDGVIPFLMEPETTGFSNKLLDMNLISQQIYKNSKKNQPTFHLYRFNLANPTALYYLLQKLQSEHPEFNYEALDPYTFFFLLRQQISGEVTSNYYIPTFLSNTIPVEMEKDRPYEAKITLRNDGWDTWSPQDTPMNQRYRVMYYWQYEGETEETPGRIAAYIDKTVPPGEVITLNTQIETPARFGVQNVSGLYNLILRLEQENVDKSDIEERIRVYVH